MERFSLFTNENDKPVYIDITKIVMVKKVDGMKAKTLISLEDGYYTIPVQDDIDDVMYAIDTKENPEFYREEGKPETPVINPETPVINPETKIGSVTVKDVLIQIRNVCGQIKDCQDCPFCEFDGHICNCVFHETYPEHWEIEEMQGAKE